jgi:hypothetical protein
MLCHAGRLLLLVDTLKFLSLQNTSKFIEVDKILTVTEIIQAA